MNRSVPRRHVLGAAAAGLLAGCLGGSDEAAVEESESAAEPAASSTPERVDPEDSGVVVTETEITEVDAGRQTTELTVEVTIENTGRFTYGTLEFRVDAYWSGRSEREREPAGFEYAFLQFTSGDRFSDGTRVFSVDIHIDGRPEPRTTAEWFDVDVAVRHADPA